jgi:hypothetical protein
MHGEVRMVKGKRPADPAVDSNEDSLITLAALARELNELFPPLPGRQPVSRQLLHKAWKNRRSRFPEAADRTGSSNGTGHALFKRSEVVEWYITYRWDRIGDETPQPASAPRNVTGTEGDTLAA